jgi:hypothetical protein
MAWESTLAGSDLELEDGLKLRIWTCSRRALEDMEEGNWLGWASHLSRYLWRFISHLRVNLALVSKMLLSSTKEECNEDMYHNGETKYNIFTYLFVWNLNLLIFCHD